MPQYCLSKHWKIILEIVHEINSMVSSLLHKILFILEFPTINSNSEEATTGISIQWLNLLLAPKNENEMHVF